MTPKKGVCDVRGICYVCIVRQGVQLEVPRATLESPCGFEIVGTVAMCPKRRRLKAEVEHASVL